MFGSALGPVLGLVYLLERAVCHFRIVRVFCLVHGGRERLQDLFLTMNLHCSSKRICLSFVVIMGEDYLTTYTFNSHQAKHTFCKICGVQSFYTPRSNPDGYGVAPHCIDPGTVEGIEEENFDGQNWEDYIEKSDIRKRSKE